MGKAESVDSFEVEVQGLSVRGLRAGSGRPLILLHGWPEFSAVWTPCMQLLASRFEVYAPDLRGFGKTIPTAPDEVTPTPKVHADDLNNWVRELGLGRIGIVAHDVGAGVAQAYARSYPSMAVGLFFFNCPYPGIAHRWAEPDHLQEIWYQSFHQMDWAAKLVGTSRDTCRLYLRHFLDHWGATPGLFDDVLEAWVDNFMTNDNLRGSFAWYSAIDKERRLAMKGLLPKQPAIDLPSRFLWGRHDPLLKVDWTDRLGEYFSNFVLEIAEDAGHFVHFECPVLAADRIAAFFSEMPQRVWRGAADQHR